MTALWEVEDADERIRVAEELAAAHPDDARITYELAGTHDSRRGGGPGGGAVRTRPGRRPAGAAPAPRPDPARLQPCATSGRSTGRRVGRSRTVAARHPTASGWRPSGPWSSTTPASRRQALRGPAHGRSPATSTDPTSRGTDARSRRTPQSLRGTRSG
jgi:hypothetical protein